MRNPVVDRGDEVCGRAVEAGRNRGEPHEVAARRQGRTTAISTTGRDESHDDQDPQYHPTNLKEPLDYIACREWGGRCAQRSCAAPGSPWASFPPSKRPPP